MTSENPSGADDQQETTLLANAQLEPDWIVGFVDGEGCFSVSIHKNPLATRMRGWQIQPVFHVYQHEEHSDVLKGLVSFFGCGYIRSKGPQSRVLTFSVHARRDLLGTIIPFFESHPPIVKLPDFLAFADITRALERREHFERIGFERVVRMAYGMNAHGKQRARSIEEIVGSSETARGASHESEEDTVRPAWRHAELSRNDSARWRPDSQSGVSE